MSASPLDSAKRRTGLWSALVAALMIGLAYASVPLYRMFCQATGFGGTTGRAEEAALPQGDTLKALAGRTIKIRFDSNTAPGMPWQFRPRDREETIKIGEKRLAFFEATSRSAVSTTGRAVFNVSPDTAGKYFRKIQCFCFTEQTLKAGETVEMPVTYFIDPDILKDQDASKIDEITLSYTFYPVDNPAPQAVSAVERKSTPSGTSARDRG